MITDTKYTDTSTIKKQFKAIVRRADALGVSDVLDRLTVEIYNDKMFTTIEKIHHFDNYVYTLYKRFKKAPSKSDLKSVAAFCQKNGIGTIAMYAKWRCSPTPCPRSRSKRTSLILFPLRKEARY